MVVSIKCYGEDGLTLAAVTRYLPNLLSELGDDSSPDGCLVFFRPSFGRSGGITGASFGEFDAIIATPKCVYLIESKWIRSRNPEKRVPLKPNQVLRHEIFEWIKNKWKEVQTWNDFKEKHSKEFANTFHSKPLAPNNAVLANNLEAVLNQLYNHSNKSDSPGTIEHILLIFCKKDVQQQSTQRRGSIEFRLVPFQLSEVDMDKIFELNI